MTNEQTNEDRAMENLEVSEQDLEGVAGGAGGRYFGTGSYLDAAWEAAKSVKFAAQYVKEGMGVTDALKTIPGNANFGWNKVMRYRQRNKGNL